MAVKVKSMAYEVLGILIRLVTLVHINAKAMITIMTLTIHSSHIKVIELVYPNIWDIGIRNPVKPMWLECLAMLLIWDSNHAKLHH